MFWGQETQTSPFHVLDLIITSIQHLTEFDIFLSGGRMESEDIFKYNPCIQGEHNISQKEYCGSAVWGPRKRSQRSGLGIPRRGGT